MKHSVRLGGATSKPSQGYSRIVVLLHGIRTDAHWHQQFEEVVNALSGGKETLILSRKYGNFPAVQYAIPFLRKSKIVWLRKTLEDLQLRHPQANICIIAHSFGTFLTTEVLKRTPRLKVDSLILCGSVVKREFEWNKLTDNNNVNQVINDCGAADLWPVLSRIFIPGTGDSGTFGFDVNGGRVRNRFFQYYDHGAFFTQTHITEYWWPFISSGTIQPGPTPVPRPVLLARFLASPLGRSTARILGLGSILLLLYVFFPHNTNLLEQIRRTWSLPLVLTTGGTKLAPSIEKPATPEKPITQEKPATEEQPDVERDSLRMAAELCPVVFRKFDQGKFEDVWNLCSAPLKSSHLS